MVSRSVSHLNLKHKSMADNLCQKFMSKTFERLIDVSDFPDPDFADTEIGIGNFFHHQIWSIEITTNRFVMHI